MRYLIIFKISAQFTIGQNKMGTELNDRDKIKLGPKLFGPFIFGVFRIYRTKTVQEKMIFGRYTPATSVPFLKFGPMELFFPISAKINAKTVSCGHNNNAAQVLCFNTIILFFLTFSFSLQFCIF